MRIYIDFIIIIFSFQCDCNSNRDIKVSLGNSRSSAQVFLWLPYNLTIILTDLIINTSMVMNQSAAFDWHRVVSALKVIILNTKRF